MKQGGGGGGGLGVPYLLFCRSHTTASGPPCLCWPRPLGHKHAGLTDPARICPFCEGKRKITNSLAGICMKQAPGGWGLGDPVLAVLPGATPQPPCLRCVRARGRAHHPPPRSLIRPIFWQCQKPPSYYGKFPRKLRQVGRRLNPSFVIKGLKIMETFSQVVALGEVNKTHFQRTRVV